MLYSLPQLPYATDSLAPIISKETIEYHYGKHEKTYIDNLNNLIKGTPYEEMTLEDIIRKATGSLFNNAAQAWNHIFYFFSFSPDGGGFPKGELLEAITTHFGSFEVLKKQFVETDLIKSGLIVKNDYGRSDIYYNRIMFPLYDLNGRVVGYSGRI